MPIPTSSLPQNYEQEALQWLLRYSPQIVLQSQLMPRKSLPSEAEQASLPAPDSPIANRFIEAHQSRWCIPGQPGSQTCQGIAAPRPIRRLVIHTLAAANVGDCIRFATVNDIVRGWQNPGRTASSHYLVDRNGEITQMVREANVAFHVVAHNADTIGIEHADVCNKPDAYTTELYERSAELVRDIARRNGIITRVFGIDTNNLNNATVVGHLDIGGHGDPGPYWDWEYYASLLRWDGQTVRNRPIRLVSMASLAAAVPTGWQSQSRVQVLGESRACIPNTHCANRNHSYGDNYWQTEPNDTGTDVVFPFSIHREGLYKISLWWPNVRNANPETMVQVNVQKAGGPAMATHFFDQRNGHGRWNDIGQPFVFTVPGSGAQVQVRIRSASRQAGRILADSVRVLKVDNP